MARLFREEAAPGAVRTDSNLRAFREYSLKKTVVMGLLFLSMISVCEYFQDMWKFVTPYYF